MTSEQPVKRKSFGDTVQATDATMNVAARVIGIAQGAWSNPVVQTMIVSAATGAFLYVTATLKALDPWRATEFVLVVGVCVFLVLGERRRRRSARLASAVPIAPAPAPRLSEQQEKERTQLKRFIRNAAPIQDLFEMLARDIKKTPDDGILKNELQRLYALFTTTCEFLKHDAEPLGPSRHVKFQAMHQDSPMKTPAEWSDMKADAWYRSTTYALNLDDLLAQAREQLREIETTLNPR